MRRISSLPAAVAQLVGRRRRTGPLAPTPT
jgi:hypothetical protein